MTASKEGKAGEEYAYRDDLACWFGLSYATFLTMPRVLMEAMPQEWQVKMARLLFEYDEAFPNQPDIGTTVRITRDKKMIPTPAWLLNYRHPDRVMIEHLRQRPTPPSGNPPSDTKGEDLSKVPSPPPSGTDKEK